MNERSTPTQNIRQDTSLSLAYTSSELLQAERWWRKSGNVPAPLWNYLSHMSQTSSMLVCSPVMLKRSQIALRERVPQVSPTPWSWRLHWYGCSPPSCKCGLARTTNHNFTITITDHPTKTLQERDSWPTQSRPSVSLVFFPEWRRYQMVQEIQD